MSKQLVRVGPYEADGKMQLDKHGIPGHLELRDVKLGRWTYCKYCYINVRPVVGDDGSVVACSTCGQGLATMDQFLLTRYERC